MRKIDICLNTKEILHFLNNIENHDYNWEKIIWTDIIVLNIRQNHFSNPCNNRLRLSFIILFLNNTILKTRQLKWDPLSKFDFRLWNKKEENLFSKFLFNLCTFLYYTSIHCIQVIKFISKRQHQIWIPLQRYKMLNFNREPKARFRLGSRKTQKNLSFRLDSN